MFFRKCENILKISFFYVNYYNSR